MRWELTLFAQGTIAAHAAHLMSHLAMGDPVCYPVTRLANVPEAVSTTMLSPACTYGGTATLAPDSTVHCLYEDVALSPFAYGSASTTFSCTVWGSSPAGIAIYQLHIHTSSCKVSEESGEVKAWSFFRRLGRDGRKGAPSKHCPSHTSDTFTEEVFLI